VLEGVVKYLLISFCFYCNYTVFHFKNGTLFFSFITESHYDKLHEIFTRCS